MTAQLSVVIPTLNAADDLAESLPPLLEGLGAGLIRELVISDGGSTDATRTVAEEAGAVIVEGPPSRGGQLRRGGAAAKGEWLLFLHADTRLPAGWAALAEERIRAGRPGHFRLGFDRGGLPAAAIALWANLRSGVLGLPYGDQGLLVAKSEYEAAGGYPDMPLMEDVAMSCALRGRLRALPARVTTSWERYERDGWARRGSRNLVLLCRYLLGADPRDLARRY